MAKDNKKVKYVRELIAKVITDPRNESEVTADLRTLSSFVTNKDEYIDAMISATQLVRF